MVYRYHVYCTGVVWGVLAMPACSLTMSTLCMVYHVLCRCGVRSASHAHMFTDYVHSGVRPAPANSLPHSLVSNTCRSIVYLLIKMLRKNKPEEVTKSNWKYYAMFKWNRSLFGWREIVLNLHSPIDLIFSMDWYTGNWLIYERFILINIPNTGTLIIKFTLISLEYNSWLSCTTGRGC